MKHLPATSPTGVDDAQLEAALSRVEHQLAALGQALKQQDVGATETAAGALHQALAQAVEHFRRAARRGGLSPKLRRRLALAGGQVAAQREAVARATSGLDRALEVLLPDVAASRQAGVYGASGARSGLNSSGLAQA